MLRTSSQLPAELASDARAILPRGGVMRIFFAVFFFFFFFFFWRHLHSNVTTDIFVYCARMGYGVLIAPLFILLSELESRKARFYMRERKLAVFFFFARIRHLAGKYD
jgi:hypothetical protein